jgi:hypothetical protein
LCPVGVVDPTIEPSGPETTMWEMMTKVPDSSG